MTIILFYLKTPIRVRRGGEGIVDYNWSLQGVGIIEYNR
jgi:hypothetical protein